jgi:hypothetical protein
MREPADRDQIDAGRGERRRRLSGDSPRGFGHRAAIDYCDSLAEPIQAHIVKKHYVGSFAERLFELVQIIDLSFMRLASYLDESVRIALSGCDCICKGRS